MKELWLTSEYGDYLARFSEQMEKHDDKKSFAAWAFPVTCILNDLNVLQFCHFLIASISDSNYFKFQL